MSNFHKLAIALCAIGIATLLSFPASAGEDLGLGCIVTPEEIAGWDIDIRTDGKGLPAGEGDFAKGEEVYMERCAHCHGEFGYGGGSRYPQLVGGDGTLATDDPRKTVGSYWPYATTVFDYVRRAMPFGEAQSLTNDEVYSVVAFLLTLNGVIDEGTVMNAETLPKVVMPNADGFYDDDRPDVSNTACMKNCKDEVTIVSNAKKVGVTPELEQKSLTGD